MLGYLREWLRREVKRNAGPGWFWRLEIPFLIGALLAIPTSYLWPRLTAVPVLAGWTVQFAHRRLRRKGRL